ncbi:hypothetical protein COLO4_22330 [Corchorus olitorius]|uniref:Uncharacterized protein n=1 Tax=Corchorus olitorius TaxID=93759 RepID=A0A1R3IMT9_9ROSI|nr:hypothetical protein COLO4_22330 [Corchorus olitorius]
MVVFLPQEYVPREREREVALKEGEPPESAVHLPFGNGIRISWL